MKKNKTVDLGLNNSQGKYTTDMMNKCNKKEKYRGICA